MTINPLIPYLPAFLSFLIYGGMTGGLFAFGRRGGHGCLFTIGFWYFFAVWLVFFGLLLTVQSGANQLWFLAGFLAPQGKRFWHHNRVQMSLAFLETLRDFIGRGILFLSRTWTQRQNKPTTEAGSNPQAEPHQDTAEAIKREQARREAEARERREQAERERQEQNRKSEPPRQESSDSRTPEEILGLKAPWTREDLQIAYRREAGRTHPDKWIGKPESIRQAMEAEYKLIQEAYRRLKG